MSTYTSIHLTECPRDAMQGWSHFIPTAQKIEYLNQLLQVGFDVLDCGSFVSPKAIPQMADTAAVLKALDKVESETKLLTIVANRRGAEEACQQQKVDILGFPFSISETFQFRNTNKSIAQSAKEIEEINTLAKSHKKDIRLYISMGFGNPYGDPYNAELVIKWVAQLAEMGIQQFALSDTVGVAEPLSIAYLFNHLTKELPHIEIGAHFHSHPQTRREKLQAAWDNGCRKYDSALKGIGGCPMADDDLVGNMATEEVISFCTDNNISHNLNLDAYYKALQLTDKVFTNDPISK